MPQLRCCSPPGRPPPAAPGCAVHPPAECCPTCSRARGAQSQGSVHTCSQSEGTNSLPGPSGAMHDYRMSAPHGRLPALAPTVSSS